MHDSKVCFKCEVHQPLSNFYKHPQMADGHLNKCKTCTKKDVKENIEKNPEYYREYDKQRAMIPHRVEARLKYQQTPEGKESLRKSHAKWQADNVIKRSANIIIGNAIAAGKIIKPSSCEACGKEAGRIHGHHNDYNYPMAVRWLCPKCHTDWHKENGSGVNG